MEGVLASGVLKSVAERGKETIEDYNCSLPVITCAASLAHQGYIDSVEDLTLWDVDLTTVPAEHLASLVSSVTGQHGIITIENVSGCGVVTILDIVKSDLVITCQSLDIEVTRALVRAMESRVEWVSEDG